MSRPSRQWLQTGADTVISALQRAPGQHGALMSQSSPALATTGPALAMRGIVKRFGNNVAVDHVDIEVMPGRVHALLGENGAGKSTLVNCLFGLLRPDEGEIEIHGRPVTIASPRDAQALGVGMVHQHFKLVPGLTVAENVFLGREKTRAGFVTSADMSRDVRELSEQYGLDVDPDELIRSLSVGAQQRVEILRALSQNITTLVLDEPTAVLTPTETDSFFKVVRAFAKSGLAIILISHHLDEVLAVADEVTVLRRGKLVAHHPVAEVNARILARLIVGEERQTLADVPAGTPGDEVLQVADLSVANRRGKRVVDALSLTVRTGEIVGLLGISGNGQTELVEAITGLRRPLGGTVHVGAKTPHRTTVQSLRRAGLAYVPEDRIGRGMCGYWSIANNIAVGFLDGDQLGGHLIDRRRKASLVSRLMSDFDVRAASPNLLSQRLSGGNAQKMVLARELSQHPTVIVCAEPTRGLDIAATDFVRRRLIEARDAGAGVLLVSSEVDEVLTVADRTLVIYQGRIIREFDRQSSEAEVGRAMLGEAA